MFGFRASSPSHHTIPSLKGSAAVWKPQGWAGLSPCIAVPSVQISWWWSGSEWPQRWCCIGSSNISCHTGWWFGTGGGRKENSHNLSCTPPCNWVRVQRGLGPHQILSWVQTCHHGLWSDEKRRSHEMLPLLFLRSSELKAFFKLWGLASSLPK